MKKLFKSLISALPFLILFSYLIFRAVNFEHFKDKFFYDNEARYAEIAKNILKTNQWVVPLAGNPDDSQTINFYQLEKGNHLFPYFQKPPLHPQIIALAFKLFGISEFAARLPSLSFSLLSLILIYLIGLKLSLSKFGAFMAIILFSFSDNFSLISSQATPNTQLLFFGLLSLYILNFSTKITLLFSAIFLSLAFMTSSFTALWLYPLAFYLFVQNKTPKKQILLFWLIPQLILILPWHLYMYSLFGNQFLQAYIPQNLSENTFNYQEIFPYLKPFLYLTPILLLFLIKNFKKSKLLILLLFFWLLQNLVLFSDSFTAFVPLSLLLGLSFSFLISRRQSLGTLLFILFAFFLHNTTALQGLLRSNLNFGIAQLGLSHPEATSLTVYKIPYESPLFYFDTGQIYKGLDNNASYLVTDKDYLNDLDPKTWQLIDFRQSNFLLKRIIVPDTI